MVFTVTLNPSLDYTMEVPDFRPGVVSRSLNDTLYPGGKGLNVSLMLNRLGTANRALGFLAGFTGAELKRILAEHNCGSEFIMLETGLTRINVKIKGGGESDVNGCGPKLSEAAMEKLFSQLDQMAPGDTLVLAGSIPPSLPDDCYESIMERYAEKRIHFAVDTTGLHLLGTLRYRPFLIKPNHHELGELFGKELHTEQEITACAKELQAKGARNVLVSMAGDGALLIAEDGGVLKRLPPEGTAANSVGAGDSMVAGFLAGYAKTQCYEQALLLGVTCGSATAFSPWLAETADIINLLDAPEKFGFPSVRA